MNTDRMTELLVTFTAEGITLDSRKKGFQNVLDFQDVFGGSTWNEILEYYHSLDKPTKGTFLWVSCNCLDKDTFLVLVKDVVCHDVIASEEQRLADLVKEKLDYLTKEIKCTNQLRIDNAALKRAVSQLEMVNKDLLSALKRFEKKAAKYDQIIEALKA